MIEITRSFAYKMNIPNYESRDFFCSQKVECEEADAEKKSEVVYEFCKNEVMKSVNAYKKGLEKEKNKRALKLEKVEKAFEVRDEVETTEE